MGVTWGKSQISRQAFTEAREGRKGKEGVGLAVPDERHAQHALRRFVCTLQRIWKAQVGQAVPDERHAQHAARSHALEILGGVCAV